MRENFSAAEIRRRVKTHYSDEFISMVVEYHKRFADVDFFGFCNWVYGHLASDKSYSEERRKTILPILKKWVSPDKKILIDLGCGLGHGTVVYASEGYEAIGVDVGLDEVKIARMRAKEDGVECKFVVADARRLPFMDNIFDICMCVEIIEHVPKSKENVIHEACRVTKRNGIIAIQTPNKLSVKDFHGTQLYFINFLPKKIAEIYAKARHRILRQGLDSYVTYFFVVKALRRGSCEILGDLFGYNFQDFRNKMQDVYYLTTSGKRVIMAAAITKLCKIPGAKIVIEFAKIFTPLIIITARKI